MRRLLVPVGLAALVLAGCSSPDRTPVIPGPASSSSSASGSAAAATTATCKPAATASYPPLTTLPKPGSMPPGTLEQHIAQRGRLIVGVSADTRLLGARSLQSNEFEGFDIEMAKQVATAIFGKADSTTLQFKAINAAQRVPFLQKGGDQGGVDMVARAMTMTCARWKDVGFAGPYFESYLKLLVRSTETATTLQQLGQEKRKVCATVGSTTLAKVSSVAGVQPVGVALTTDCMVLWQEGQVDAIAADDAILAGLKDQDPSAKIVGNESVEKEPYGLAVAPDQVAFARFVNTVLEQMRKDGSWQKAYNQWLGAFLKDRSQPAADYSRPSVP